MQIASLLGLALLVFATCQGSAPLMPSPEPGGEILDEANCTRAGGEMIISGFGIETCVVPTPDAGKSCRQNSDCAEGICLAESDSCAPSSPYFGCNEVLIRPSEPAWLCVD